MSPSALVVIASLLFATMGVCVRMASADYGPGEIVMYRSLIGAVMIGVTCSVRGDSLRTRLPAQHALRSTTGVIALCLWFYAIANLPLATAITLNYTSSLWLAVFVLGSALVWRRRKRQLGLVMAALVGFAGVVLVLRPTLEHDAWWAGVVGLVSGLVSALGYLQVAALGRMGEPDSRIVFYFSVGGIIGGAMLATLTGWHGHTWRGAGLLLAVGVLATVAQLLLTRAYVRGRTLVNASLQYLGIGFSFVYGVLLFDDHVTWLATLGMVLIVYAGVRATAVRTRTATSAPRRAADRVEPTLEAAVPRSNLTSESASP
jgi:S-adenosylmethionine uptake transporter